MSDSHPELFDDDGWRDDRPVRTDRRRRALRIVVLIALAGMLLPLVLSAYGVARAAAERACAIYALDYSVNATSSVSFQSCSRIVTSVAPLPRSQPVSGSRPSSLRTPESLRS